LKHLNEIINEGARGTLISTIPPFTLPAWTSIFTGVNPGKHGITDNIIRIGDEIRPALSMHRKVPLLWKLVGNFGLKPIVVNDPVTYPPERINGIMVTGFLTPPNSNSYVYPPEIKEEVDKASGGYLPELPLDYDRLIAHDRKEAYDAIQRFAQKTADLALYLMKNHEWDVFDVTFTSTDRLQHFYWHDEHSLREHYIWLDSIIEKLAHLASDEQADIIIVSDHGFAPIRRSVHINTILANEGLIQIRRSKLMSLLNRLGLNSKSLSSLLRHKNLHEFVLELLPEHLRQAIPSKESEFIFGQYIAKLSSAAGIFIAHDLCSNYEAVRNHIIHRLLSLKDDNKNVMAGVYKREDVLWGPFTSRAPDLFAVPSEGYYLSTHMKNEVFGFPLQSGSRIPRTGGHRMQGIFVAYGPDIKEEYTLNRDIRTWDIAPTILRLLGLPIPRFMDGNIIESIFREGRPGDRHFTHSQKTEAETDIR